MPIFVNEGYEPAPDGKEWKHVARCDVLEARASDGFPMARHRNMDTGKTRYSDHQRRRCPVCMPDSDFPGSEPHNAPAASEIGFEDIIASAQKGDHPDLASEQAVIDYAYECLEHMIAGAGRLPEAAAHPKVAPAFRERANRIIERLGDSRGVVFGRIDPESESPLYIGRNGIHDKSHSTVVVPWQADAAIPYYTAVPDDAQGLLARRFFDIDGRRLRRILEERFGEVPIPATPLADAPEIAPISPIEDVLLAELNRERTDRMRDIVATIQREQYRLMAAPLDDALVIQGAPGTGKTAVGLHRASWLLFNHRDRLERSGVLVVGPNRVFMRYIADVLPSLGEEAVDQSDINHLVGRVRSRGEDNGPTARLKGDPRLAAIVASEIWGRIRIPGDPVRAGTTARALEIPSEDVRGAIEAARAAHAQYMDARRAFTDALRRLFYDATAQAPGPRTSFDDFVSNLNRSTSFRGLVDRIWSGASSTQVIRELLGSRDRLARSGESLSTEEIELLYRRNPDREEDVEWTEHDLPLVDEAEAILNGVDERYGHVIVDEAQDLTPMQLRMVGRRAADNSLTLLGDIAQSTGPWIHQSWDEVAHHIGVATPTIEKLLHVYRVPREVMELAIPVLAEIAPDVAVPTPFRDSGEAPSFTQVTRPFLGDEAALAAGIRDEEGGTVGLIAPESLVGELRKALDQAAIDFRDAAKGELGGGVELLTPRLAKGLEFDHVVVVEPLAILREARPEAALRELYVALTRPTRSLAVFHSEPLPTVLGGDGEFVLPESKRPTEDTATMDETVAAQVELEEEGPRISSRLSDALAYARLVGARRPETTRLVERGFAVAGLLIEAGAAEEEAIAALLKPVAETQEDGIAEIRRLFGPLVAEALERSIESPDDSPISVASALQDALVAALREHDAERVIEAVQAIK